MYPSDTLAEEPLGEQLSIKWTIYPDSMFHQHYILGFQQIFGNIRSFQTLRALSYVTEMFGQLNSKIPFISAML